MNNNVRQMTLAAVMAALQTVLLYLGSVVPSGRLALAALAGVLGAGIVMECGYPHALSAWVVVSFLGLLLLPQKGTAIVFAAFFGWYPMVKSLAERLKSRIAEWAVKLLAFNAALALCWVLLRWGFLADISLPNVWAGLLILGAEVIFVLFDFAYTGLIAMYERRLRKKH